MPSHWKLILSVVAISESLRLIQIAAFMHGNLEKYARLPDPLSRRDQVPFARSVEAGLRKRKAMAFGEGNTYGHSAFAPRLGGLSECRGRDHAAKAAMDSGLKL